LSPRGSSVAGQSVPFEAAKQVVTDRLAAEVKAAVASGAKFGPPLAKWLARDLVLEAFQQAGGIASKAATYVGLPETTFSRRLRQAEVEAASTRTPDSWVSVRAALADLLRAPDRTPGNLVGHMDDLLFQLVVTEVPDGVNQAAGLMGVSVPTMKRRLAAFRQTGGSPTEGSLVLA